MLTLRLNVKHSTSALGTLKLYISTKKSINCSNCLVGMELEVWPSTVFCAPMELCSTSSTLSVIGGSMWTAHW